MSLRQTRSLVENYIVYELNWLTYSYIISQLWAVTEQSIGDLWEDGQVKKVSEGKNNQYCLFYDFFPSSMGMSHQIDR